MKLQQLGDDLVDGLSWILGCCRIDNIIGGWCCNANVTLTCATQVQYDVVAYNAIRRLKTVNFVPPVCIVCIYVCMYVCILCMHA